MQRWCLNASTPERLALWLLLACNTLPGFAAEATPLASPALNTTPLLSQSPALASPGSILPVDQAFVLNAFVEADRDIVLVWDIHSGYYLYRKSLSVVTAAGAPLTNLELPAAEEITDEFFGAVAIYRERLLVKIPLGLLDLQPGRSVELQLEYQGCAEDLYCYPPVQKIVTLALPD